MRALSFTLMALAALGLTGPAPAEEIKDVVIYENRDWSVHEIDWPGQGQFCVALVKNETSSFSIWMNPNIAGVLRFQSADWAFDTASGDLVMEIDSRGRWSMDNAAFEGNVIWFRLYESDLTEKLINQVSGGNTAKLFNTAGKQIESWPLAGSSASIQELRACTATLPVIKDSNPFD